MSLGPIAEYLGINLATGIVKSIELVAPVLLGFILSIEKTTSGKLKKRMLRHSVPICSILAISLAFSIFLGFDIQRLTIRENHKAFKPDFILINESVLETFKGVNLNENDAAYVAWDKFTKALNALKARNIADSQAFFRESITKCEKSQEKRLNKLWAASYNNLVLTEYLDPDYERLKDKRLNMMNNHLQRALELDRDNDKIQRNSEYLALHKAIFRVLGK